MKCMTCFNEAKYVSRNSNICLCEDCYNSMSDDYESSFEDEYGIPFNKYYDIEELEED